MTIDEAIKHCMDIAETQEMCSNGKKCAEEHRQLAEWLKELKALKERTDTLDKIRAEIGIYEADCRLQGGTDECEKCNSNVFGSIYRIIGKYTAESEVQDADSD